MSMLHLSFSSVFFSIHFISFVLFRYKSGTSPRSWPMASKHGHNLQLTNFGMRFETFKQGGHGKKRKKTRINGDVQPPKIFTKMPSSSPKCLLGKKIHTCLDGMGFLHLDWRLWIACLFKVQAIHPRMPSCPPPVLLAHQWAGARPQQFQKSWLPFYLKRKPWELFNHKKTWGSLPFSPHFFETTLDFLLTIQQGSLPLPPKTQIPENPIRFNPCLAPPTDRCDVWWVPQSWTLRHKVAPSSEPVPFHFQVRKCCWFQGGFLISVRWINIMVFWLLIIEKKKGMNCYRNDNL